MSSTRSGSEIFLHSKFSQLNLPTPSGISIAWNFGRILGALLGLQIVTGLFLSIHYNPRIEGAFDSVLHITRDVRGGWFMRSIHANGARFFFLFIYLHLGRGLYFQSYSTQPKVWMSGVALYLLRIAIAFLGYVLPWGQMSLWGATVITNLVRAVPYVGPILVEWVWGGFRVGQATLNRFFSLHFILPLVLSAMVLAHLWFLHEKGRRNPLGDLRHQSKVSFQPYFVWKDFVGFGIVAAPLVFFAFYSPWYLGDPDNFLRANELVTPAHIKPEWYFLFAYAILRVIPRKLGGVLALLFSILVLLLFLFISRPLQATSFNMTYKFLFWGFVANWCLLTWLGGCAIDPPFTDIAPVSAFLYFLFVGALLILTYWGSLNYQACPWRG